MTVVVASYQRRDPLLRLLGALEEQWEAEPELAADLDVVVVLDGSTDGSREAVERRTWSVPVTVHWQANRGAATARNAGLALAGEHLVWFLDDDLVPSDGLLARHRRGHGEATPSVLVGPCRIPTDIDGPRPFLRWWEQFNEALDQTGRVERFDQFTTANASAPAAVFRGVGGFDETFAQYGLEDYELGYRLLRDGVEVRYDGDAVAWHPDIPPDGTLVRRQRSLGRNAARMVALHPDVVDDLFPPGKVAPPRRFLRKLRLRRPASLLAVSHAAYALNRLAVTARRAELARRSEWLARAAAHGAGVAEGDPSGRLLDRVLGR